MANNFKLFDVKHGLSVNGLPFVDENRNVTLNNLTVQGTSTVIDTRTVEAVDPIISLGVTGSTLTATSAAQGTPGRFYFSADDLDDFALSDSVKLTVSGGGAAPGGLTDGTVYYVKAIDKDVSSSTYGSITISATQGGSALAFTNAGSGTFTLTLNPLQDLDQDLGIEINYVEGGTAKQGFFGYDHDQDRFTFLKDTTYAGSDTVSDDGSPAPAFSGTKAGAEFSYIKLEPTASLSSTAAGIDLDQTWNGSGQTFDAATIAIVDTASANGSTLIKATVGGNNKFVVRKDGVLSLNTTDVEGVINLELDGNILSGTATLIHGDSTWGSGSQTYKGIDLNFTQTAYGGGSQFISLYGSANRNFVIDAEGEIVSRSEFTGGGVQTALLVDVTDTSSDSSSLLLDLQVGNSSKFKVDKGGSVTAQGTLTSEGNLTVNGTANIEDDLTIQAQTNGSGAHNDTTNVGSKVVTIPAGNSTAYVIDTFAAGTYTSVEYLVQVKQANGRIHTTKVLLAQDGTDIWMTEYGTVYSNDIIVTFDAGHSGGNFRLLATKTSAAATANSLATIKVTRIAITA